jgi:uncharacterized protein (TIGR02996 family)
MNATERGLLQAIATEPDDDTHRLVYADWIDDHGDPERAEFIRAQIRLANDSTDSPERRALAHRAHQLREANETRWLEPLEHAASEWTFRRGFVESVSMQVVDLDLMEADRLPAILPIRHLAIREIEEIEQLHRIAENTQLISLDLTANNLSNDDVKALARMPALRGLRRLSLQFNRLTSDIVVFLTRSAFFRGLDLLRLGANPIEHEGRFALEQAFGSSLSFVCEREADQLYAFDENFFRVGEIEGHYQVFLIGSANEMHLAVFDYEGNLIGRDRRMYQWSHPDGRQVEEMTWLGQRQFRAGRISVKRFRFSDGEGINDYAFWQDHTFDVFTSELDDLLDNIAGWVHRGDFVWEAGGNDVWVNRSGEVTDT